MSKVWVIADTHFGHKNMAIKRGFKDEFEHDEHIIDKWNSVVHKRDTVYILGDVTMESKKWFFRLDSLAGRKIVVLGNHDMRNHIEEMLKYVDQVVGMVKYSVNGGKSAFLTHCPIHTSELEFRVSGNVHGHIHENIIMKDVQNDPSEPALLVPDERYVCVSAEQVNYTPVSLADVIEKIIDK